MKRNDFVKTVGSLTIASFDILVPACFIIAVNTHYTAAAITLGVACFAQWIRTGIVTYLMSEVMSEDKIA